MLHLLRYTEFKLFFVLIPVIITPIFIMKPRDFCKFLVPRIHNLQTIVAAHRVSSNNNSNKKQEDSSIVDQQPSSSFLGSFAVDINLDLLSRISQNINKDIES